MNDKGGNKKGPIDRLRDGAGAFKISTPDDDSPITGMMSLGKRLLVIKRKGIYEVKLADQIDPERTNINAPNTIQRVLSFGSDDPWVGAVVLTAHELLKHSVLDERIDCEKSLNLVVDIAQDIAAAKEMAAQFSAVQDSAINSFNAQIQKDRSVILPSTSNGATRCKEFLQKLDHSLRELFKIVKIFYENVGLGGWESLKSEIDKVPHGIDKFPQFLQNVLPFLQMIRNSRNCVEHPRPDQKIVFSDFSVNSRNILITPMIEIIHPKTPLNMVPVSDFMDQTSDEIVRVIEQMLVFLCARHIRSFSGFPVQIYEFPAGQRRTPNVRYGYGVANGDAIVPFG
jgi:hypothetical protein